MRIDLWWIKVDEYGFFVRPYRFISKKNPLWYRVNRAFDSRFYSRFDYKNITVIWSTNAWVSQIIFWAVLGLIVAFGIDAILR